MQNESVFSNIRTAELLWLLIITKQLTIEHVV
jgi:hypothetical protein